MWKESINAKRFNRDATYKSISESLLMEMGLSISFNGRVVFSHAITPSLILEYALGYLYCHGLISGYSDVKRLEMDGNSVIVEGERCELPRETDAFKPIQVKGAKVVNFMSEFQEQALLVRDTGISESAALCDGSKILAFVDDMHALHCLYKLIGYALKKDISFQGKWIIVSGRITLDVVEAAFYCGLSQIVARGGATAQAYRFSDEHGITLIVFARGKEYTLLTPLK